MATYWENSCSFGLRYVSWYKCLIVSLVFSHLGFWSGDLCLIAPFPDLCLLVPFYTQYVFNHRNGIDGVMTFTTPNPLLRAVTFYHVIFDHVTLHDTMLFMEL